jgi:Poly(ADP-ribose) polymerase catalytic domain
LKITNNTLKTRFEQKKGALESEMRASPEIWEAFHGSPDAKQIANNGFDVGFSRGTNMFGRGIYFAPQSSKANQYTFGKGKGRINGCPEHGDKACTRCTRRILMCLCIMGKQFKPSAPLKDIPGGYHSVVADPKDNPLLARHLKYPEYAILHGHQVIILIRNYLSNINS